MRSLWPIARPTRHAARNGVQVVEFAIVLPLLLLLLGGILEFGQAFYIKHSISIACRRGARAAIVDGVTSAQVITSIREQCEGTVGVAKQDVTVLVAVNGNHQKELADAVRGDEIEVAVGVPFSKCGMGFFTRLFDSCLLSSTCVLEHE